MGFMLDDIGGYSHVGGLERDLATSDMLTITVLIPLPLPSTWKTIEEQ